MPHNPITLLSRDNLDRWHVRQELERARAMYQADPTADNKTRYVRAYHAVLTWVMDEAGIKQPEGMIGEAAATLDARLNIRN